MVNSERICNSLLAEIGAGKKAVVTTVIENILQNDCHQQNPYYRTGTG